MLLVLQRHCPFMPYFLVLWYPGRDGSEETEITLLKTAWKVPSWKGEGRTQSAVTHPSNPAMRLFTAVLDPPAPLDHRHSCSDVLAWIYFQHLQRSCTSGAAWIGAPSCWTWYKNHRAKTPKRWTQTAGLQVNTARYGLFGFYLPVKLCFILSHFIPSCCYLCSLERHILYHFPRSILVLILPVEWINGTLFSSLVIFVTKVSESIQWKWRSISTAIWLMVHSDS